MSDSTEARRRKLFVLLIAGVATVVYLALLVAACFI
jgi:hypothetical protein